MRGAQLEAARLAGELEAVRASMSELEAERAADRAELAQAKALNSALQAQVGLPLGSALASPVCRQAHEQQVTPSFAGAGQAAWRCTPSTSRTKLCVWSGCMSAARS